MIDEIDKDREKSCVYSALRKRNKDKYLQKL